MDIPLRRWALAALLPFAVAPHAVKAQEDSSFYGSVSGMYVVPRDSELSQTIDDVGLSAELELDGGFGFTAAAGYGGETGPSGEIEFGYRSVDINALKGISASAQGVTVSVPGEISVDGDVTTLSLMANGIYVFEAGNFRPYFGGGLGLVRHDATMDAQTVEFEGQVLPVDETSDDDVVFAYQAMAGVSFPISEGAEIRAGYRYFATAESDFDGTKTSYGTHNFEVGMVFRF